jgi:hypothetical protein
MNLKVLEVLPKAEGDTLDDHQKKIKTFKDLGYPVEKDDTGHFCQDRHALKVLINGNGNNEFQYQHVPLKLQAFCDGASSTVYSVFTLLLSISLIYNSY